jgi:hypothetical protein
LELKAGKDYSGAIGILIISSESKFIHPEEVSPTPSVSTLPNICIVNPAGYY